MSISTYSIELLQTRSNALFFKQSKASTARARSFLARGLLLAALLLSTLIALPAYAFCGFYAGKADASLFNEASQVVMVRDGRRTVITMLNDYKGPLDQFALVVPTPTVLQKGQVQLADRKVFERLDAYSSPRLAEYHDGDPCRFNFYPYRMRRSAELAVPAPAPAAAPAVANRQQDQLMRDKALGVTVELQYSLGEYEIVNLSATQSDGLETWLRENGYKVPKGTSAALKPYLNQGMKFFVAKVSLQSQSGKGAASEFKMLSPLQFAFETEKFMLPMRLGMLNAAPDQAQDLIVYALTRGGRVESSNYRTVKLPANVNLPASVKPKFQDFYKTMFQRQAEREDHRVVFTEYFWDMSWCDPCADNPLTPRELRQAGVFWADQGPAPLLTRMHLRYTPNSFPEDLMFTQTQDKQNWQTRYVIHHAFEGSVDSCSNAMSQIDCSERCAYNSTNGISRRGEDSEPYGSCMARCNEAKLQAVQSARQYYEKSLPQRLATERQTLAQLTGWVSNVDGTTEPFGRRVESWWQRHFREQGGGNRQ